MRTGGQQSRTRFVEYDGPNHRLWILGQRCHHGATGTIIAAAACVGLIAETAVLAKREVRSALMRAPVVTKGVLVLGGAMILHDWKDRAHWFERGRGSQP
jgi:hypothetical protein